MDSKILTRAIWVLLVGLICQQVMAGGIYRWMDSNGSVHYGDEPPKTAAPNLVDIPPAPAEPTAPLNEPSGVAASRLSEPVPAKSRADAAFQADLSDESCAQLLRNLKSLRYEDAVYRDELGEYHRQKDRFSESYEGQRYYLGDLERDSVITEIDLRFTSECRQSPQALQRYEEVIAEQEKSIYCRGLQSELARLQRAAHLDESQKLETLRSQYKNVCGRDVRMQRF